MNPNENPSLNIYFTKDDFFNEYEMKQFVSHLSQMHNHDAYMKKAIINRAMIEIQSEEKNSYEKLMGYIHSKGIEQILQLIEKKTESAPINEKEVEKIVHRILNERNIQSISVITEKDELETNTEKQQNVPLEERKKPSKKLKDL